MENNYTFVVRYKKDFICTTIAHTKFEAIDKIYYQYILKFPHILRENFNAKKLK